MIFNRKRFSKDALGFTSRRRRGMVTRGKTLQTLGKGDYGVGGSGRPRPKGDHDQIVLVTPRES